MKKGQIAAKAPVAVDVEKGKTYWWCACGMSKNQPFCDGSHKVSEFEPVGWEAGEDETKYFCACKQTDNRPFCDGSHNSLSQDASGETLIEQRENGPFVVKNLSTLKNVDGEALETKPVMALCRCGKSGNKPFCDGSHKDAGFSSAREVENTDGKNYSYEGEKITVYYNKLLCSHAAECGRLNSDVFNVNQKPWIQPDKGSVESIREVVTACPSGALSMSEPGEAPEHLVPEKQQIMVQRHGPYWVQNVEINDVEFAGSATPHKYVLCRCGLSKNKPFCDGTHRDEKWRDDS